MNQWGNMKGYSPDPELIYAHHLGCDHFRATLWVMEQLDKGYPLAPSSYITAKNVADMRARLAK